MTRYITDRGRTMTMMTTAGTTDAATAIIDLADLEAARVNPPDPFPNTMDEITKHIRERNIHLFVAVPCYGCKMSCTFVSSILRFEGWCLANGLKISFEFLGNESLIPRGRNILAERAMRSGATHLLFIDADIGFQPLSVLRLLAYDAPVTAGIYAKKGLNWADICKSKHTDIASLKDAGLNYNINFVQQKQQHQVVNGFVKVHDAATGFMLIRMDTLRHLRDAYADTLTVLNDIPSSRDSIKEYVALFDCMICPTSKRYLSEDYAWCRRVQEQGLEVYADLCAPLTHTGSMLFHGDLTSSMKTNLTLPGATVA